MEILEPGNWVRPELGQAEELTEQVYFLLEGVRVDGDDALIEASTAFDGFEPYEIELEPPERYGLEARTLEALRHAASRIERFARFQMEMYGDRYFEDETGRYGQRVLPLDRIGAYVPGGRHPLISTALMTLIPARVAGVGHRIAVSPSDHPALLAAASLAGAHRFVRIGGAQAIAMLAYGSRWNEPVDMIVGPGNAYVNAAKALVQSRVKIDTLAGPSELLILADDASDPRWLVEDMLAQAEHDPMALSILASSDRGLLERVGRELGLDQGPAGSDIGLVQLVHAADADALVAFADRVAPEHLMVCCADGYIDPERLRHHGSLFDGALTTVALGDYCSGPNHTLPTRGVARQKGGLSVGDFLKIQTYQKVRPEGFAALAATTAHLAELEGLRHHGQSVKIRLDAAASASNR